jgi:hypothetical protein
VGKLRKQWAELSFEQKTGIVVVPIFLTLVSGAVGAVAAAKPKRSEQKHRPNRRAEEIVFLGEAWLSSGQLQVALTYNRR